MRAMCRRRIGVFVWGRGMARPWRDQRGWDTLASNLRVGGFVETATWGDTVIISNLAPESFRPGSYASVCGMRQVETAVQASEHGCTVGETLYLVEFGDGWSVELTGNWIDRVEESPAE